MSPSTEAKTLEAPPEWPPEILRDFKPTRALGKGGFGSVVLAKRNRPQKGNGHNFVAIKVVGSHDPSKVEVGYAHREIDILGELSHPRIIRLVKFWEPPLEDHRCAAVMALSYAPGPTLEYILQKVGAPSLAFARIVSAQLIDALAYLHSHGVVHRDVKPDNLIVTGASLQQDDLYEQSPENGHPNWKELRAKWHVTLVDFGFARALSPDDVQEDVGLQNSIHGAVQGASTEIHTKTDDLARSLNESMTESATGSRSRGRSLRVSRHLVRTMSALGNRAYAAPEIKNKVRRATGPIQDASDGTTRQTATLLNYVADYGMMADAFSAGSTVRYTLTGVAPQYKVEEVVAAHKAPAARAARWLSKKLSKKPKDERRPRGKRFRGGSELPAEAVRMIKGMTRGNPKERTTVRAARLYPWIDDVMEESTKSLFGEVQFLKCAIKKRKKKPTVIVESEEAPDLR